ncbi:MAG: twin-arginine translocase subunit TatC [Bacteroidetes bacterium]|nr:twin-arginine translocase subunit TatC [Bacteroidota bacterium]HET6243289.1 twin-arginine translocase subunit TatC [Bacteroidia bacterium]
MSNSPEHYKAEMSFLEHLEALRWHLMRIAIAVGVVTLAAFLNKSFIFDFVILAPKNVDFWTYGFLCQVSKAAYLEGALCITEIPFTLINIDMSGQFSTHILVSVIAGIVLSFPYIVWELWRFVMPALHAHEKKYSGVFIFSVSILFLMGILFGYYFVAPLSVNFLGSYQVSAAVANQISLLSYISTISTITLASGLVFELPVLVYFLTKIGLVTPAFMRIYRKHSIVVILILSAIITPPDISSQILVSIPILVLYEISIFISAITLRKQIKN